MTNVSYLPIDYTDLAWAALLLLVNAGLSIALNLGLGRQMLIAAVRMIVQLLLIGLVLDALFAQKAPWLTASAATVMIAFAGYEILARQSRPLAGKWTYGLGAGSMTLAGILVTWIALTTQVKPDPWYDPRFAIPLLGMILGNTMTGVALGLDRLLNAAARERAAIEARLCLGQSFREAMNKPMRDAFRAGLTGIINSMAASGVVSLPGMMTGQILAGAAPQEAVKYQILIMFLIAGGTGLGVLAALGGAAWRLTDERHRLRLDRLAPAKE